MTTSADWSVGFARQADADFRTFQLLQISDVPECHKLHFLQMACEKLVKAHLCGAGTEPSTIQASHAFVAKFLPRVLDQYALSLNFSNARAREILKQTRHLAQEVEILAPALKRGGQRPDNCEYPWEDNAEQLHVPLDWTFPPSRLIVERGGPTILKLIRGAIDSLL